VAGEPPPELVAELYGLPLDEFVSARDARAKELRRSGDRAAADAVKRLRKPSVSAGAVNRLARRLPEEMEALLGAGEALRQAQLGAGDREAIRSAAHDEREAVERLVGEVAAGASASTLEEVRETLHAAASDDETRELVRRGLLTEARRAMGFAPFGGAVAAPEAAPRGAKKEKKKKASPAQEAADAEAEREKAAAARAAETERKRASRERVKAARSDLKDAERDARGADHDRDEARKALDRAERIAAAAHEEVERRRAELDAVEKPA
jgi:hypothetical protein